MKTNRLLVLGALMTFALSLTFVPAVSEAASRKPSVRTVMPTKNATYDRTEVMPVRYELTNVTKDMVVVTDIKLLRPDRSGPPVGWSAGSGWHHVVYAGDTEGEFEVDWGLNETIPGVYSITQQLKACSSKGCNYSPAGKALSRKTKPVRVTIENSDAWEPAEPADGVSFQILSPEGGETYRSKKRLSVKWEAEGVPSSSVICVTLIRQSTGGGFVFPGNRGCKPVRDGKGSVTGTLTRTAGYDLAPGEYYVRAQVIGKSTGGKDGPLLAEDMVTEAITIR